MMGAIILIFSNSSNYNDTQGYANELPKGGKNDISEITWDNCREIQQSLRDVLMVLCSTEFLLAECNFKQPKKLGFIQS